jgi:DNA-directed RNA polymerase specialized sigma24 family protein
VTPDGSDKLAELPTSHAVALRLQRAGASDHDIAVALGVDVDAVPDMLDVARRKLEALRGSDPAP